MPTLRIRRRPVKGGFQYFSGGELVGEYRRGRFFSTGYRAVTFQDGREKYVLRGLDLRTYVILAALLLAALLPGAPQGVFAAVILIGLLVFPRPPAIWENGQLAARQGPRRRFIIGQDCYELCAHTGFKDSLVKNGRQIALYHQETAWGEYDPPCDVLYSASADPDLIVLFCVCIDATDVLTRNGKRLAPWKDWVPVDRHPERASWTPEED